MEMSFGILFWIPKKERERERKREKEGFYLKPLAPLERTVLALELRLLFYLLFRVGNHHPPLSAYHFVSFSSFFFFGGRLCPASLVEQKRFQIT